ncbi:uncharacterized protein [Magallana gigas]|uniref:uncharacterized protein n=1 Tax=Magallana gigas TaxID=29159 RepID=UPI00333E2C3D
MSRFKRYITQEWMAFPSLEREKIMTRETRDVQFNISTSREIAETVCTSAFDSSEPYKTCHKYVSDLSNSSLSNCINDVIMTGDHSITAIHVEAALHQCVTFVGLNTTLQNVHPTVTLILQNLCPSNCSGHGVCNTGNCSCEVGFGGSDCSFDILSPPVIWESTPTGTCDKSLHQCSRIYFNGRYFLETVEKNCFITKQFIDNDGSSIALTQLERPLEEENLFRGSCSLPSDDVTSWVTKYMFNVSFDRKQFTQTFSFFIYQSECQYHTVEKGYDHFILKKGYCFINSACIQHTVVNPENLCEVCDPGKNSYQWSENKDCVPVSTSKPPESSASTFVFIVIAAVMSFLVLVTLIVCIKVWRYKRSRRYANFNANGDQVYKRNVVRKYWMRLFDDGKFSYTPEGIQFSNLTYSSHSAEGPD